MRRSAFHACGELWRLPSERRFAELSQKTSLQDALRLHSALTDALVQAGVQPCEDQGSQARAKLADLLSQR